MMNDEQCENYGGPKIADNCRFNQRCIVTDACCWLRSGVTLLTLLSFYAHTKNKHLRLQTKNAQNRAIMESVNSVYTCRVDAGAVRRTAWYFATGLRTAPRSSPDLREAAEDVAATVSQTISPGVGRTEGVGS